MATTKQKLVIGKLLENTGVSLYKAMVASGYSPATARTPSQMTESKGFQELLEQHLPDSFLLEALEDDIKNKKGNRKGELELAFKVRGKLGLMDIPPTGNTYNTFIQQNNINPNAPEAKALVDSTLDYLMNKTKQE